MAVLMGEMSAHNSCSLFSQLSLSFLQSVLCFRSATVVVKQVNSHQIQSIIHIHVCMHYSLAGGVYLLELN